MKKKLIPSRIPSHPVFFADNMALQIHNQMHLHRDMFIDTTHEKTDGLRGKIITLANNVLLPDAEGVEIDVVICHSEIIVRVPPEAMGEAEENFDTFREKLLEFLEKPISIPASVGRLCHSSDLYPLTFRDVTALSFFGAANVPITLDELR